MLLGRDDERRRLAALLADARIGTSGSVVIRGEPGVGKTALLGAVAEEARGMRILRARGVEAESGAPFAGLHELLGPVAALAARLPGTQAAALSGALGLGPRVAADRVVLGAATLGLLALAAEEGPLLVLVDDGHWLDAETAEALAFAARRLVADPIAVVVATRDEAPSPLLRAGLDELVLGRLDAADAATLLEATAGGPVAPELVDRVLENAAGNPLAVVELGREAERLIDLRPGAPVPVSTSVEQAFARRLVPLSADCRRALLLAATAGPAELGTAAAAAADAGAGIDALGEAEEAGLLWLEPGLVEFRHPLVRSAVYRSASPAERRAAHRALAAREADPDRRAWHLGAAAIGPDGEASAALTEAGARARESGAHTAAAAAFERAARLDPDTAGRAALLTEAGAASGLAGDGEHARALLDEARALAVEPGLRARIGHLQGLQALRHGSAPAARRMLQAAALEAEPLDRALALRGHVDSAWAAFYSGEVPEMVAAGERALRLADGAGDEMTGIVHIAYGMGLVLAGRGTEASHELRAGVTRLEQMPALDPETLGVAMAGPLFLREAGTGRGLLERALETARAQGAIGVLPMLLDLEARAVAAGEDWDRAHALYGEAIALAREIGQHPELAIALAGLSWLEAREGREAECRAHAAEAMALTTAHGITFFTAWAVAALADLALTLGAVDEAVERLLVLERHLAAAGVRDADVDARPTLVEAYVRAGRLEEAQSTCKAFAPVADARGQPWARARLARCRGLLAPDDGFDEPFVEALALQEQTPDAFEQARTALAYGERLRRARRRTEARMQLRTAFAAFDRLGAAPWAERAREELAATGEQARRREASTRDLLTPRELSVALALAEGRTTREAAATLYLSPKTVEYHLRHVYQKLGVASREELAAAMRGQG
jgi:DNA-binding CsgD family transcriptional regulator